MKNETLNALQNGAQLTSEQFNEVLNASKTFIKTGKVKRDSSVKTALGSIKALEIYARFDCKCVFCGKFVNYVNETIEHIIKFDFLYSIGIRLDDVRFLAPAHSDCNKNENENPIEYDKLSALLQTGKVVSSNDLKLTIAKLYLAQPDSFVSSVTRKAKNEFKTLVNEVINSDKVTIKLTTILNNLKMIELLKNQNVETIEDLEF